jgi:DNA gyrase subunit A
MTNTGQSVRIRAADIRITGRNASGVKLMNLKAGEVIQDIARVVNDDEDDETEVAALPETDPSEIEEEIIDDLEEEEDDDSIEDDENEDGEEDVD